MKPQDSVSGFPPSLQPGDFPLDYGSIYFKMHRADADAEFIRCRLGVDKKKVVKHAMENWGLETPGVLLRICGTTPHAKLGMLEHHADFVQALQGVLKAATTARGWLFSTGLNFGIGGAVGSTLARGRHHCDCPLIGFTEWEVVQGKEQIVEGLGGKPALAGSKRVYTDCEPNADMSTVSLQANHSHYVLVGGEGDEGSTPPDASLDHMTRLLEARKRSFNFAHLFEEAIATSDGENERDVRIPRILMVLCGDETTLEEVLNFCRIGNGIVVFATPTGGLAEAISKFCYTGSLPPEWSGLESKFDELRELNEKAALRARQRRGSLLSGTFDGQTSSKIFNAAEGTEARFPLFAFVLKRGRDDTATELLDAIMGQIGSARAKVRAAVEWDDGVRLSQIFTTMVPAWLADRPDILREATQLALTRERVECIKVLVDLAAPVKDLDLLALYDKLYDADDPPRYPMFVGRPMPTEVRAELEENRSRRDSSPSSAAAITAARSFDLVSGALETEALPAAAALPAPVYKKTFRTKSKETPVAPSPAPSAAPVAAVVAADANGACDTERLSNGYDQLTDEPMEEEVYQFYPREVWATLDGVVPGLCAYWRDVLAKKEEGSGGDGDAEDLASGGKVGARWIDIYVWAVLLGNTELATLLLPACQEPMRAAVLGARIFDYMANAMPLNAVQLRASAETQEEWAIGLLDLCDNFQEARRMLITRSSQWQRTVLHLALQSGLRNFCAHHHCQTLCDEWLRGNNRTPGAGPMPVLKSRESPGLLGMLRLLAFAVFPVTKVWGDGILEWSLPAGRRTPPDYSPPVGAFYRIPVVKGTIRLSIHVLYIAFMSYTSMEASRSPDVRSADLLALDEPKFHQGGGQDKLWVNFVSWLWTVSLALDEWYKYIQEPSTFQADFWNHYDYAAISLTLSALAMRFWSLELEVELLSFALLLIWCRIFKYLTSNQSIGLLVIMIMNMFKDIALWALVSGIFLAAYTVAFVTISDPDEVDYNADTPLMTPIWAMFGSFDNHEVHTWNQHAGQILLWTYLVVSNIVLVNLLIAMMGDTYGVIKDKADEEWKFGRLLSVVESTERMSPVPPPLNLPITLSLFLWRNFLTEGMREGLKQTAVGRAFASGDKEENDPVFLKALEVAQMRKRKVARRLLLALQASQEAEDTTSVLGRLEILANNLHEVEENVAEISLMVDGNNQRLSRPAAEATKPVPVVRAPLPGRAEAAKSSSRGAEASLPAVAEEARGRAPTVA